MDQKLKISYVPIASLCHTEYNPRVINENTKKPVRESFKKHGPQDPLLVNRAPGREGRIIAGNLRWEVMKDLGYTEVPVMFVNIQDLQREKDLCLRMNKAVGEWDLDLLAKFDEIFLTDIGFSSEELDDIFGIDENPEVFDLEKELKKLEITEINIKHGDRFRIGDAVVMNGDSTVEADMLALMAGERADMVLTDPPYLLNYGPPPKI